MISTNQFKIGMTIVIKKELYQIIDFQHVKPGKGGAFVRTKLKSLDTGAVVDKTFRAGEKFEQAHITRRPMQYLYAAPEGHVFMDTETYDQISLPSDLIADQLGYLAENMTVLVVTHEGQPIGVELPASVEIKVQSTDPGVKGDTATGGTKPATLETGLVVQVPLFIESGDVVKVDTRTGDYITRA